VREGESALERASGAASTRCAPMSGPLLPGRGGRVTAAEVAAALVLGVAAGLVAGYVLMGTAHAILEIGADASLHYKHGA
jgi:hypothetical protein